MVLGTHFLPAYCKMPTHLSTKSERLTAAAKRGERGERSADLAQNGKDIFRRASISRNDGAGRHGTTGFFDPAG